MSLLLDALKRAEQEKLARQGGKPEGSGDVPRPPAPPLPPAAPAAATAAPAGRAASLELQPLGSGATGATGAMAANSPRAEANAAQNMFSAKASPADGSRKGAVLWIGLGILVVIVAAAGGYVWYATQSFAPRAVAGTRSRPSPITPAPVTSATTPSAPQAGAFVPTQQPTAAIQPPVPAAPTVPAAEEATRSAASAPANHAQDEVAALLRDASRTRAPAPVKLSPSREVIRVPAEVSRGYRELAAGNVAAARPAYRAALEADPANLDALLGMATIEALGGNRYGAAALYQRALAVDPRNATAQAGLAALEQGERPENQESRVAAGIAQNPQSPQLRFALGNLFASQSRWNEAQVQYFEAYRLDPASADLAYNLAVSLDHLRQPRLAAEYYARALELARNQAAQFDPAAAARRLAQLKG